MPDRDTVTRALGAATVPLNAADADVFAVLGDPRLRDLAAEVVRAYLDALDPAEVLVAVDTDYDSQAAVVADVLHAVRP
jgi:hypothetical protein